MSNVTRYVVDFGIDCDPFQQRPNDYAMRVFEYLDIAYEEPYSKLFGAWQWNVEAEIEDKEEFEEWIKEYMDNLYNRDKIRGARWDIRAVGE